LIAPDVVSMLALGVVSGLAPDVVPKLALPVVVLLVVGDVVNGGVGALVETPGRRLVVVKTTPDPETVTVISSSSSGKPVVCANEVLVDSGRMRDPDWV